MVEGWFVHCPDVPVRVRPGANKDNGGMLMLLELTNLIQDLLRFLRRWALFFLGFVAFFCGFMLWLSSLASWDLGVLSDATIIGIHAYGFMILGLLFLICFRLFHRVSTTVSSEASEK